MCSMIQGDFQAAEWEREDMTTIALAHWQAARLMRLKSQTSGMSHDRFWGHSLSLSLSNEAP
jgi:hypothetical protein